MIFNPTQLEIEEQKLTPEWGRDREDIKTFERVAALMRRTGEREWQELFRLEGRGVQQQF